MVSDLVRGNQLLRGGKLEEAVDAFQKAIAPGIIVVANGITQK
ncbi:MAG: tetratricopeptide repeat protein [Limnospira sp. PMC 894.15]|nr:tetratricopeptide repeat protein [Limnospira sp. PMC 894.15]MDT9189847.1 tetratricopeptide repeat protein [Limnospira sp. PMC 894.15]